ncbi:MAG: PilZ domain-containing protein, partial [Vicinamibacterales bacterium]
VWYRIGTTGQWRCSVTQNISCTGAAIRTTDALPAGTPVTVRISLRPDGSRIGGYLTAVGEVVRKLGPSSSALAGFAMAVTKYRIDPHPNLPRA